MTRNWRRFVALAVFSSFLSCSCAKTIPQIGCKEAQAKLHKARDSLNVTGAGGTEQFDLALASVKAVCDVSTFDVGMNLVEAYEIQGDAPSIEKAILLIKPASDGQLQQLELKKLDFYSSRGLFDQASKSLQLLRGIPADPEALDLAEAQMECRFGRCGTKLDELQGLTKRRPLDAALQALLAFSLADRQDFQRAAPVFDRALELNPGSLDEVTALVAVVTYCNVGQKDKARRVYDIMSGDWGVFMGVSAETLGKMRNMIRATSGEKFHFSSWPIDSAH